VTPHEAQATVAVLVGISILAGVVWRVSGKLREGEDAKKRVAQASTEAQRHQATDDRLGSIEHDLSSLQAAQKEQDKRIASIERTMATREDITATRMELSNKIDSVKNEIIAEIARLMAPRRRR
jgi:hypothetical protein